MVGAIEPLGKPLCPSAVLGKVGCSYWGVLKQLLLIGFDELLQRRQRGVFVTL
ncbi:hypothetical protein D3C79_1015270 [compost metagenome]